MKEDVSSLWQILSPSARQLAAILSSSDVRLSQRHLTALLPGAEISRAVTELKQCQLIQETTLIAEQREQLERLASIGTAILESNAGDMLTDDQLRYLALFTAIIEYDEDPSLYEAWREPRYQIVEQYRLAVQQLSHQDGSNYTATAATSQ